MIVDISDSIDIIDSMNEKKLYSTGDAVKIVNASYLNIYRYAKSGKIDAEFNEISRRVKITEKGLQQLIEAFGERDASEIKA